MMRFPVLAAFAALATIATPAPAQIQQFKAKDKVTVDPTMSYVVIRTNLGTDLRLFKLLDEGDRQRWEQARQEAYDKARKKYERQLTDYERDIKAWNKGASARRELGTKPQRPAEITLESTPVAPIELGNFQIVFRGRQIGEDADKVRTFLIAVKPGTYVIYGAVGLAGAVGAGSCYCMGSVAFVSDAGRVVDAGTLRARGDWYQPVDYTPPASPSVPSQLTGGQVVPAKLLPAGKMANFFGTPVTRINPVPGVLGYARDVPLDIAAGNKPVEAIR